MVVGGDFNCTINPDLDRNHDEPHPSSAEILKMLLIIMTLLIYGGIVFLELNSIPG